MAGRKTPLWSWHREAGAKMVEFAGWEMPVQYRGILEEHMAVRQAAGLFDISHMGEIRIRGKGARDLLQLLLTNDVGKLLPGRILYSPMCQEDGGTVDDLLLFQLGEEDYLAVVNAANEEKDFHWMREKARAFPDVAVENESARYGAIALQGPFSQAILEALGWKEAADLRPFRLKFPVALAGVEGCLISRTGYTGEDGFEIYAPWDHLEPVWRALLDAGSSRGLQPCGLGSRDSLRLEAALPLYGQELSPTISPLEAGLEAFVRFDKGDFIGREALWAAKEKGMGRKLSGILFPKGALPRHGYPVYGPEGEEKGFITSGGFSPVLDRPIALALVEGGLLPGEKVEVAIRTKRVEGEGAALPFYRRKKPREVSR